MEGCRRLRLALRWERRSRRPLCAGGWRCLRWRGRRGRRRSLVLRRQRVSSSADELIAGAAISDRLHRSRVQRVNATVRAIDFVFPALWRTLTLNWTRTFCRFASADRIAVATDFGTASLSVTVLP